MMHSARVDKITPIEEAWQAVIATPEYINWLSQNQYVIKDYKQRGLQTKLVREAWQAVEDSSVYQNYALQQQCFTETVERERLASFQTWFDLK